MRGIKSMITSALNRHIAIQYTNISSSVPNVLLGYSPLSKTVELSLALC